MSVSLLSFFIFFNDTATTEIYTLSLHDVLPICQGTRFTEQTPRVVAGHPLSCGRSEEHTSELQSLRHLVCRLLLEKTEEDRPLPRGTTGCLCHSLRTRDGGI